MDITFSTPRSVTFYQPVWDQFKNDPKGEVGQSLAKRGKKIQLAAKRQVGVDTTKLRDSIYFIHERVGSYQQMRIGSEDKIALLHHTGTRPHEIEARNAQFLRFTSKGRVVYTRKVLHPGTRPNHYLSDQLYLAYV